MTKFNSAATCFRGRFVKNEINKKETKLSKSKLGKEKSLKNIYYNLLLRMIIPHFVCNTPTSKFPLINTYNSRLPRKMGILE